ncbi:MAG: DUF3090 family protein [Acidimicrobiia bacterium]|nr:DUF3090 family protein [Acidimicrobiia bacterium]
MGARMMHEYTTDDIVVDAVGPPGRRVFYIQARQEDRTVTLKAEKQQVEALAGQLADILDHLVGAHGADRIEPAPPFRLQEPLDPLFVIGAIGVGFDEDRDLVLLQLESIAPEGEEADEDGETVRIWASRTRMRSLASHAADVVAAGRPTCELCGNPKDDPHVCPRTNGHAASA